MGIIKSKTKKKNIKEKNPNQKKNVIFFYTVGGIIKLEVKNYIKKIN